MGSGGQSSCSDSSSSTQWDGSRSGRVERSCPSFVNVGPSSARSCRNRAAVLRSGGGSGASSVGGASRPSTSRSRVFSRYAPNPCRATA